MEISASLHKINKALRIQDWRLSFIPFILGCVYAWLYIFNISFSARHFLYFILSILTSAGFAALGYFINEFFDQKDDALAGKINKISLLSKSTTFLLFVVILLVTFLPWIVLPKGPYTIYLISAELVCFVLYSLPIIKLKKQVFLAGILDALYAYLLPCLLSYYTFSMVGEGIQNSWLFSFFLLVLMVGYRNIFIHQVDDVLNDQRAKVKTLPQFLGIHNSVWFLQIILFMELLLLLTSMSILLWKLPQVGVPWAIITLIYIWYYRGKFTYLFSRNKYLLLSPERHLFDQLYQLYFPLVCLLALIVQDARWLLIIPFHFLLFIDLNQIKWVYSRMVHYIWHNGLKPLLSALINYPLFILFFIFGIDLRKENRSALEIIQSKFKK